MYGSIMREETDDDIVVNGKLAGSGTGPNKKAAENSAAEQALKKYEKG